MNEIILLFWGFIGGIIATVVFVFIFSTMKIGKVLKQSEDFNKLS